MVRLARAEFFHSNDVTILLRPDVVATLDNHTPTSGEYRLLRGKCFAWPQTVTGRHGII